MAHVGGVAVLVLLLGVRGVGMLAWLLYVGDGGLLARLLRADDVGVLARVVDAGDVAAAVVGLLLLLHVVLGLVVSHGPVERPLLGPTSAVDASCCSYCSWGRIWGGPFGKYICICGTFSGSSRFAHAWLPGGPQQAV